MIQTTLVALCVPPLLNLENKLDQIIFKSPLVDPSSEDRSLHHGSAVYVDPSWISDSFSNRTRKLMLLIF